MAVAFETWMYSDGEQKRNPPNLKEDNMVKAIKLGDTDGLNLTLYNSSGETIIFGDGSGDLVQLQAQFQSGDTIANNTIVFGNGNADTVADNIPAYGVFGVNKLTNNTIIFGDGQSDGFFVAKYLDADR